MATVIEMPKLSDTMEEGAVANWLKKEGEPVKEGEPLVEIETDKATQEYESPATGVLYKIVVKPGSTVKLRTPIAVIAKKDEAVDLDSLLKSLGKPAAPAAPASAAGAKPAAATPAAARSTASVASPQAAAAPAPAVAGSGGRIKASPLAKKIAKERGIDLAHLSGSGPGGRIVQRDLEQAPAAGVPASQAPSYPAQGATQLPVSMMRKTIAKRLLAAKNDAPHFYLTVSVDCTRLGEWRARLNEEAAKSGGALPKVSVNDIITLAVSRALKHHPMVNASWQGDFIVQNHDVHVAIAVALPEGLVTPVLRHTDRMSLREIARQTGDLAGKAKAGKLANQDFAGGTFTISNLGMFGIEEFTAIINPPQACILAVGAAQATPAVDAKGQLVVQQRMKMTMSCDHRVVDGATGAQFLQTLTRYLEDPLAMMS
jgi:pyruvate dehydrogenase E2 component (dihydrolipoamide acetyltransferase)